MAIQFNNTTDLNGLIQICERLTTLGDGGISGDSVLLKQFTSSINDAYDEIMPLVLASDGRFQFDDYNNTTLPIATANLTSGTRDYGFTTDSADRAVLQIDKVAIKQDATSDDYYVLNQIDQTDPESRKLITDNASNTGIPSHYDIVGGSIIFDVTPNYSATAGLKIWYSRTPVYFSSTDTTNTPGIPDIFHQLLAVIAAHEWVFTYMPNETTMISRLEKKIQDRKMDLSKFMANRAQQPIKARSILRNPA